MTTNVRITASGVTNEYGQAQSIGTTCSLPNDYASALVAQGKATLVNSVAASSAPYDTAQNYTQATFAFAASTSSLPAGNRILVDGLPYWCISSNTAVAQDGEALSTASEDVLAIDASTTARANPMQSVDATTYSMISGLCSFRTTTTVTVNVGDLIRVAAARYPEIEGRFKVVSQAVESGTTRITARIQDGLMVSDKALGAVTGSGIDVHLLQHWSTAAGWPSMLQTAMGGRIRCITNATGSTNVARWNDPYRQAQIASYGRVGAIIIGGGIIGNSLSDGLTSAAQVMSDLETLIQYCRKFARIVYVMQPPTVTNENGISPKVTSTTAAFTVAARVIMAMDDLPKKYPYVRVLPVFAAELVNYGGTTTVDITNSYSPYHTKADDGVHNVWGGSQVWASTAAAVMSQDFPYRLAEAGGPSANVFAATTADVAGKKVQNLLEGALFGTVANTGSVPTGWGTTVSAANGMTAVNAIVVNPDGGSDWITTVTSNGNVGLVGTAFQQQYTGSTTSLKTQLNLAANQGVDIDTWIHCGVYGFNEESISYIEVVLEGDTGDGRGFVPIASGFSTMGQFQMGSMTYSDSSKAACDFGFWGCLRFPRFQINPGTVFTSVQIRQTVKVKTSVDPGVFSFRWGSGSVMKPLS